MLQNFLNKQLAIADLIKSDDETKGTVEFYYYDNTTPTVPSNIKIDRCGNYAKIWAIVKPKDGYKIKQWSDQTTYADSNNRLISGVTKDLNLSISFTETAITGDYLTFTNEASEDNTLNLIVYSNANYPLTSLTKISNRFNSLSYRLSDAEDWVEVDTSQSSVSIQFSSNIQLRGLIQQNWSNYTTIYALKSCSISGLLTSLYSNNNNIIYLEDINASTYNYIFSYLFITRNLNISSQFVSVENLIIPQCCGTASSYNYIFYSMFHNCYQITVSPKIPDFPNVSVSVAGFYGTLFWGCNNLEKVISYITDNNYKYQNYTDSWLYIPSLSAANPKFYNLGGATFARNDSGVPSNWTILTSLDE